MEYVIGSFITIIAVLVGKIVLSNIGIKIAPIKIRTSQSYSFNLLLPQISRFMIPFPQYVEERDSQSSNHDKSMKIKMVIYNDKAYWIHDNIFYTASVVSGVVIKESTKVVDTMGMSTVELKELAEIVEKLTEGTGNDSSNSGNQKF